MVMMVNNMTNIEGSRNDDEFVILLLLPDCYDISLSLERKRLEEVRVGGRCTKHSTWKDFWPTILSTDPL